MRYTSWPTMWSTGERARSTYERRPVKDDTTGSDKQESRSCPQCGAQLTKVGAFWVCPIHGQAPEPRPFTALRIFLSYGHDANEELVRRIKADLLSKHLDVVEALLSDSAERLDVGGLVEDRLPGGESGRGTNLRGGDGHE